MSLPSRKPPRKLQSRPRRNLNLAATNLSENKINHLALHLEYLFERGVNFRNRVITITGEISDDTFSLIDSAMTELEAQSRKAVTVRINSGGGSVYDALAIVGRLKDSPCMVITEGYGCVMSAATVILASGDKRRISQYSWFMHHESVYEAEGRHSQMKALVKQSEREEEQWSQTMASFTKKTASFWSKTGAHLDAYFSPNELLEFGVVDEVF